MNKKNVSYILLIVSAIFLAFSIRYAYGMVKTMFVYNWSIDVNGESNNINLLISQKVDELIDNYPKDSSKGDVVNSLNLKNKEANGISIIEKSGHNMRFVDNNFATNIGCTIIRIDKPSTIKYSWTNIIGDGTIRWVIKDINKNIIVENDEKNISTQGVLELNSGDYFLYVEGKSNNRVKFKLYCQGIM